MYVIESLGLYFRRPARGWLNWTHCANEAHAFIDANAAHRVAEGLRFQGITSARVKTLSESINPNIKA